MYANNSHSYTHLILALRIVIENLQYGVLLFHNPSIHDIGLAIMRHCLEHPPNTACSRSSFRKVCVMLYCMNTHKKSTRLIKR